MINTSEAKGYRPKEYQNFDDLRFVCDDDDPNAVVINIRPSLSDDELERAIITALKVKLAGECWWLSDKIKNELGLPKEQTTITARIGEADTIEVDVYNFGESLSDQHKAQIVNIIMTAARINNGEIIKKVKYIFIGKTDKQNELTGELTSGEATLRNNYQAIQIYPHGLRQDKHRTGLPSSFEATVAHEIGHVFGDKLLADWENEFGWKKVEQAVIAPGGRAIQKTTSQPCVSDYAAFDPAEDLSDSVAVYLLDPEVLKRIHPGKFKFLEAHLPILSEVVHVKSENKSGVDIKLPSIDNTVKYKVTRKKIM